jgi:hypothetical protein
MGAAVSLSFVSRRCLFRTSSFFGCMDRLNQTFRLSRIGDA